MPLDLPTTGVRSFGFQRSDHLHNGVDLYAPEGKPIYAAHSGRVRWATDRWLQGFSGYGRVVSLDADDGTHHLYAHLSRAAVPIGARVQAGDLIGYAGRTGYSRADHASLISHAHLHFELSASPYPMARATPRIDPVAYLLTGRIHPVARVRLGGGPPPPPPWSSPPVPPTPPPSSAPLVASTTRHAQGVAVLAAVRPSSSPTVSSRRGPPAGAALALVFALLLPALVWSRA